MLRSAEGREFDVQTCLFGIAFRAAGLYLILSGVTVFTPMLVPADNIPIALPYSRPLILVGFGLLSFILSGSIARAITREKTISMSDRRAWRRFGDVVAALGVAGLFGLMRLNYLGYHATAGSHAYVAERGWFLAVAELLVIGGIGYVLLRYDSSFIRIREVA